MIKGRKTTAVAVATAPVIDEATTQVDIENISTAHFVRHGETYELGQIIGRKQASEFLEAVSISMQLAAYEQAKKSTAYKNITNPQTGNAFPSIDEFCRFAFGVGDARMRQLIANRNALGQELFEKSVQLGLGRRDYAAVKALPADDQELIKHAIETATDREAVTELLMELNERHVKKVLVLEEEAASKDKVIVQKNEHIAKLVETQNRREGLTDTEKLAELEKDLNDSTLIVIGDMQVICRRISDLRELDNLPQGQYVACANSLQRIVSEAMMIASDFGIELTLAAELDDDVPAGNPNGGEDAGSDWIQKAR